ncbi:hypothetical protein PHISP_07437 [Aspergillus sp. HF37]|nr:hypothetical protein PHISP_07437 [Aspergillus sp. HF37]
MATARFDKVEGLDGTISVTMNAVQFIAFQQPKPTCLVTEGLNGCSAIAIVSQHAAILAHVVPRLSTVSDNPHEGDQNMQARMNEVAALFRHYSNSFGGNRACVVYAVMGGSTALPDQKAIIDRTLQTLGLDYTNCPYIVVPTASRQPGHGTIVIDARSGSPKVYVDDERVN